MSCQPLLTRDGGGAKPDWLACSCIQYSMQDSGLQSIIRTRPLTPFLALRIARQVMELRIRWKSSYTSTSPSITRRFGNGWQPSLQGLSYAEQWSRNVDTLLEGLMRTLLSGNGLGAGHYGPAHVSSWHCKQECAPDYRRFAQHGNCCACVVVHEERLEGARGKRAEGVVAQTPWSLLVYGIPANGGQTYNKSLQRTR